MRVSIEEVWADDASQLKVAEILLRLPPLDQELENVSDAAKDLRELAWLVSDEGSLPPISREAGQKELRKLARLCDNLISHIGSMHQTALEHLDFPYGNYYERESATGKRLVSEGCDAVTKADREEQANWEKFFCPSPFDIAGQLKKLSQAASNAVPQVVLSRRGRPRKPGALLLAEDAAQTYERMTGRRATITTPTVGGKAGGRFLAFLTALLAALGIDGSPEALARRVLEERNASRERKKKPT